MLDLSVGQSFNVGAWVLNHNISNENGDPITFKQHRFLLDIYLDNSPELVISKCSQIGGSTAIILKAIHLTHYKKANVIYLLPSKSIVKDFVLPKVDPLINTNPAIKKIMGNTDNMGLKSFGLGKDQRFLYFRSSWDEDSGISLSANVVISDEYDRSNRKAIDTYQTRLDASRLTRPDLGYDWRFSNPTFEGSGVDELYQRSDQKRWIVKCSRCNAHQELTFPENIDFERKCYICSKCFRPMDDMDRIRGQWVKMFFGRDVSGYRVSQLMATWIPAKEIIKDSLGDQSIFHNFTLGLPYTSQDTKLTREALTKCIAPDYNPRTDVAIGVDNGIIKHYVIGNRYGVFQAGSTESWQEIENLRNQYDAYMVIDHDPYPTPVMKLVEKYRGKVFANRYNEDKLQLGTIRWDESDNLGIVKSDRTKLLDAVVADINAQDVLFNMSLTDLENEEFITHCLNVYRIVEESTKGIRRGVWKTIGQEHGAKKPDHLFHALCYFKVALAKTLSYGGIIKAPLPPGQQETKQPSVYVMPDGRVSDGLDLNTLLEPNHGGKSWIKN